MPISADKYVHAGIPTRGLWAAGCMHVRLARWRGVACQPRRHDSPRRTLQSVASKGHGRTPSANALDAGSQALRRMIAGTRWQSHWSREPGRQDFEPMS